MSQKYTALYEKRKKVQPLIVNGPFQYLRYLTIFITLSFYFVVPWITWGGRQAIWFDLPGRKFYVFGITFWPQDFFVLTWLMIIAALALFLATVVAGRLWCGYTCPQTVWTKLYMFIEQLVEGDRRKRIKLDKMPMSFYKLKCRIVKHSLWLLLALITAVTFVGFFSPIRTLLPSLFYGTIEYWDLFWILFFTLATYLNAGWMREQVCLLMCPYARFQSVMFDKDTLVISYDHGRGDPRGARKKGAEVDTLGDCINCYQCVHVCPTGIDIRDGLQMQCIGCAACIDACDRIMEKMGYRKKLIKYSTQRNIEENQPSKIIRTRPVLYAIILLALLSLTTYHLISRPLIDIDIIRDRNQLFRITNVGDVENVYQIKIMNKSQSNQTYQIAISEPETFRYVGPTMLKSMAGEMVNITARIVARPSDVKDRNTKIKLYVTGSSADHSFAEETRFIKP